jgi:hypothetical protein
VSNFQVLFSAREKKIQLFPREGVLKNLTLGSFFCQKLSLITFNKKKDHLDTSISKAFQ